MAKYPEIIVRIGSHNEHIIAIYVWVKMALRRHNVPYEEVAAFSKEAGEAARSREGIPKLIEVCEKYVTIEYSVGKNRT